MAEAVSLPIFPAMTDAEISCVKQACAQLLKEFSPKAYVEI